MCGISGIVGSAPEGAIREMTAALVHRGPDGEGFYRDEGIALGQRRLSIIDLEGGRQPIANEDETLQLVCNGEIYNSPELRRELEARGHRFRTRTDVEVILHLYEEHGVRCAEYLRGMFAFAIWDKPAQRLTLARDHMGQKPLFFAQTEERFLFASEIKGILASQLVRPEIDLEGLWHYVSLRYLPEHYTLFRGIQKLPAATMLVLEHGKVTRTKYWEPSFREKIERSEQAIEDELDELLQDIVSMHTLSDVRVGAFLSGGIDSSTVSAMMAQQTDEPVPVFSIGVKEHNFNELPYARMVAQRYRMEAHEQIVNADLVRLIPTMVWHMEEPSDPFGLGVYLVSKLASDTVKVVLTGDGGDENFAGYDRYVGQRLADWYALLPHWLRQHVMRRLIGLIPESYGYKSVAQKAAWINEMSLYDRGARYAHSLGFLRFTPEAKKSLFSDAAQAQIHDDDSTAKVLDYFDADNADELVDKMLYTDLMTRMPDHLLALGDRMSMAHSLEARPTLVDYKLVEYAARIPSRYKLKGRQLKYLLRKVAARHLPRELVYREKQGFSFPLGQWMRTDLAHFLENLFSESRFVAAGLFNEQYMRNILAEHVSGQVDHNYRLWILMNLEYWYRIYFEGQTVSAMQGETERLLAA